MTSKRQSQGIFPAAATQNPDDAAKLTTSYSLPGGVASARTVQVDFKGTFGASTETVILQIQRNSVTVNETLSYNYFVTDNVPFAAGEHRTSLHLRGFGVTGLRICLSSTATNIYTSCGLVA